MTAGTGSRKRAAKSGSRQPAMPGGRGLAELAAPAGPSTVAEVQSLVRDAGRSGEQLVPVGLGRWPRAGGWAPERAGGARGKRVHWASTAAMDGVHHYEPADLTLTAGAGITLSRLGEVIDPNGQWLPFDAPGCVQGTLGAAVASGVSGPLRGCYGATRDNVLGLEVVDGSGRILRLGGRVVKNVAGYDLVRLLSGSRGSLGIVTRVSVRLFPRPEADQTLIFADDLAGAVQKARTVCTGAVQVAAAELWPGAEAGVGGAWAVVARLLGGPEEVREIGARVVAALGAEPSRSLDGAASRRCHEGRVGWEDGAEVVARLAALPSRLDRVMAVAGELAAKLGGVACADAVQGVARVRASGGGSPEPAADAVHRHRADPVEARCDRSAGFGGVEGAAGALAAARGEMEAIGGSLVLSTAADEVAARVGWSRSSNGEVQGGSPRADSRGPTGRSQLAARLKALFDPQNVLAPRCP